MINTPAPGERVGYERNVKPLFRDKDRSSMLKAFDLWSYADVSAHADAILAAVRGGSMPCDGAWTAEQVDVVARWIADGKLP